VHELSPGLVLTDLLLADSTPGQRRFFNALAEEPETVARELVPRMREIPGTGGEVRFLRAFPDAPLRILSRLPEIIGGGRFFDKEGNRVPAPGARYNALGTRLVGWEE